MVFPMDKSCGIMGKACVIFLSTQMVSDSLPGKHSECCVVSITLTCFLALFLPLTDFCFFFFE